ncbi:MAG: exodeoxyribonuclease VII large subunit [Pseudomonadota bacterium]
MSESNTNALELTVTELAGKLKRTVEDTFGHVRVRGEISGFRGPHSSGHCYFALAEGRTRLEAVIWRGVASKLKHMPEEGLEVIASGKLTTYPGSSKYQIVIDNLEPAGAGALMALLEERKRKLAAEGLFAEGRKQLLPFMPRIIGVVTSPTGAVIRDILHRLADRFPVHVIVWPVRVQGETSGREVANGVYQLNQFGEGTPFPKPDVIIVARGGGSMEDLWGFNDEALVRAVAGSDIPVISAVGHETDWTLVDYAADWRAPTPTAAAEKAVPVKAELTAYGADLTARLRSAMTRLSDDRRKALQAAQRGLLSSDMLLAEPRRRFDDGASALGRALEARVLRASRRFEQAAMLHRPSSLNNRITLARQRLVPLSQAHGHAYGRLLNSRRERLAGAANRVQLDRLSDRLALLRDRFQARAERVQPKPILAQIQSQREQLAWVDANHARAVRDLLRHANTRLDQAERLRETLSYKSVLKRGYAVLRDGENKPVSSLKDLSALSGFVVEMADGEGGAMLTGKRPSGAKVVKKASKPKSKGGAGEVNQGQLF